MTGCRSKLSLSSESNVKPLLYAAKSPHFWQWGAGSSISRSPLPENHPISMIWDFKQHLPLPLEVVKWLERGWKPVYQPHLWTAVTGRIQKVYYDAQKRLVLVEHSHAHAHTHTQNLPSLTLLYAEAQRGSSHLFPTQGKNLGLPYCRQILYHLSQHGNSQEKSRCLPKEG